MKKLLKIITIVVVFGIFTLPSAASEIADGYLDEFYGILPEGSEGLSESPESLLSAVGLDALIFEITSAISAEGGAVGSFFALLLGSSALMCAASLYKGPLSSVTEVGVCVVCSLLIFRAMWPAFSEAMDTVLALTDFFAAAVPIMTGITLAGGGTLTAGVQAVGMNFTLATVGGVLSRAFVSLAAFAFSLGLVSAFGDSSASTVARALKSVSGWLVGIATTLIIATLSLQTVVASATDSAAMRAAKYAAQGIIPVVGGTVSGALGTLAAGLAYVKDTVGVGAIAVSVTAALSPLVIMLLYRLALSLAATLSGLFCSAAAVRTLGAFRYAADSVTTVYSLSVLVYIFEVILFMKGGVSIL